MTDDECFAVGYDESGNQLYASVQPLAGSYFQMGLYSEAQCITPNTLTSYTYDDFADQSELNLGSKDATDDDAVRRVVVDDLDSIGDIDLGVRLRDSVIAQTDIGLRPSSDVVRPTVQREVRPGVRSLNDFDHRS